PPPADRGGGHGFLPCPLPPLVHSSEEPKELRADRSPRLPRHAPKRSAELCRRAVRRELEEPRPKPLELPLLDSHMRVALPNLDGVAANLDRLRSHVSNVLSLLDKEPMLAVGCDHDPEPLPAEVVEVCPPSPLSARTLPP